MTRSVAPAQQRSAGQVEAVRAAAVKRASELTFAGTPTEKAASTVQPAAARSARRSSANREVHVTAGGVRSTTEGAPALIAPSVSLVAYRGQRGIDGGTNDVTGIAAGAREAPVAPAVPHSVAAALARSVFANAPVAANVAAPLVAPPRRRPRSAPGALPTAGPGWFDMPSSALTPELKRDLAALAARGYLDPKRHYKTTGTADEGGGSSSAVGAAAGRRRSGPAARFVQLGTVVEGAAEFYSARIPARQRKATLVEQLLAADSVKRYAARNYEAVRVASESGGRAAYAQRKAKQRKAQGGGVGGGGGSNTAGFKRKPGGGRGGGSKRGRF